MESHWVLVPHLDMGAKIIQLLEVTWGSNEMMDFKVFCKLKNTPEVVQGGQKSQVTYRMMSQKDNAKPTCFLGCLHHLTCQDGCWLSSWLESS